MKSQITCSGLSNTGRLTTQVATILTSRHPDTITWTSAHKGNETITDKVEDTDLIIINEGCSDNCA